MRPALQRLLGAGLLGMGVLAVPAGDVVADGNRAGGGPAHQPAPFTAHPLLDVIATRPEARSVLLSILQHQADESVRLVISDAFGAPVQPERQLALQHGEPATVVIVDLHPDTGYRYEVRATAGDRGAPPLASGIFHTQRAAGQEFAFTLSADSHLDQNTDPSLYVATLKSLSAESADFHIDLGDTFMVDKHPTREAALAQYLQQRHYFGLIGKPLHMVLGNHDGEDRKLRTEPDGGLAAWANQTRSRYFPDPQPDGFFSGDAQQQACCGWLQDYFSWQWGDALFVVLDPYWHGERRRSDDGWELTLGQTQYRWLKATLEASTARFKFVFIHQLAGGIGRQGRGGIEAVPFGEWGGKNQDGSDGFAQHRPGWPEPIHALLQRTGVTAVFHGHDHLFARQSLDGITYQEVPQPAHPGHQVPVQAQEYGYRNGTILGGSGYLRVRVAARSVKLEFVETTDGPPHVADSHEIPEVSSR